MSRRARHSGLFVVLAGVVTISACGATAPSPTTGLTGTVVRGPITPVCRIDVPCEASFSAGFTVQRAGREVARFQSDAEGQFTVRLDAGTYSVVPDRNAPLIAPTSQSRTVTVGDTGLTAVRLTFDTGIR